MIHLSIQVSPTAVVSGLYTRTEAMKRAEEAKRLGQKFVLTVEGREYATSHRK